MIDSYLPHTELKCERCDCFGARYHRQNTNYIEEERNWVVLCKDCEEENDSYWEGMWEDYYASRF